MRAAGHASWRQTTAAKTEAAQRPVRVDEASSLAEVLEVPLLELLTDRESSAALRELLAATARLREAQVQERRAKEAAEVAAAETMRAFDERRAAAERFNELQRQAEGQVHDGEHR